MSWDYMVNGHYFFSNRERGENTDVLEFQKGANKRKPLQEDSMYLLCDDFRHLPLDALLEYSIPDFESVVVGCQIYDCEWDEIMELSRNYSMIVQKIIDDMDSWMRKTIEEYGCVTAVWV